MSAKVMAVRRVLRVLADAEPEHPQRGDVVDRILVTTKDRQLELVVERVAELVEGG